MTTSDEADLSQLPRRLEQAVRDESPAAVAALFTEDGSFWIADERSPKGDAAVGRDGIEALFASWFGAVRLRLSIDEASHSVDLDDDRLLQSGVFTRSIGIRETGEEIEERGGYVRLVKRAEGIWRYQVLSVVVLPPGA